jgi:hypothetical protein
VKKVWQGDHAPPLSSLIFCQYNCFYFHFFSAEVRPDEPLTEEEQRQQMDYEEWLMQQANFLGSQVRTLESQVTKLRRQKKSLTSKQKQVLFSFSCRFVFSPLCLCHSELVSVFLVLVILRFFSLNIP